MDVDSFIKPAGQATPGKEAGPTGGGGGGGGVAASPLSKDTLAFGTADGRLMGSSKAAADAIRAAEQRRRSS